MTPEQVARQHENAVQGFELVDYAEIGLPLWQLNVETVVVVRKALQPIKEFVLRALEAGLASSDLAGFLGLDDAVVRGAIADLASDRLLVLGDSVTVSEAGKKALSLGLTSPSNEVLPILFDGIMRKPLGNDALELAYSREIEDGIVVEVPAMPSGQPTIDDLKLVDIDQILQEQGGGRGEFKRDILRLKRIMRFKRLFRRGIGLVFKSKKGELRTVLVVNGVREEALEHSFAEVGGNVRKGLLRAFSESHLQANIRRHLGPDASRSILEPVDYAWQQRQVSLGKLRVANLKRRALMAAQGELQVADAPGTDAIDAAEAELAASVAALGLALARPAAVYECAELLERGLAEAKKMLSISTKGFAPHIVDTLFVKRIAELATRGVVVTILFQGDAEKWRVRNKDWQRAYDSLLKLSSALPMQVVMQKTKEDRYYHLAWDNTVALVINRPVLSNHGRNRTFEQFAGFVLQDHKLIEKYLARVHAR